MQFDYFYGSQADQFSFYRIPKVLFTDPQFKPLSTDAKVLYGILLDRMSLSVKNHWLDEQSRVYIIFTTEEIMEALSCANQKACRLMLELEKDAGLIERKRQGLGKPSLIYVKNFAVSSLLAQLQNSFTHSFIADFQLQCINDLLQGDVRLVLNQRGNPIEVFRTQYRFPSAEIGSGFN